MESQRVRWKQRHNLATLDAQDDTLKHKGYMGIWSKGTNFTVDQDGVVQESQWSRPRQLKDAAKPTGKFDCLRLANFFVRKLSLDSLIDRHAVFTICMSLFD